MEVCIGDILRRLNFLIRKIPECCEKIELIKQLGGVQDHVELTEIIRGIDAHRRNISESLSVITDYCKSQLNASKSMGVVPRTAYLGWDVLYKQARDGSVELKNLSKQIKTASQALENLEKSYRPSRVKGALQRLDCMGKRGKNCG